MATSLDFWNRAMSEPFEWGKNDCALWVSRYIEELTGFDPASNYRGSYTTKLGAFRILRKSGGLEGLCESVMVDFPLGDDVGVAQINGVNLCGIRNGDKLALKGDCGLLIIPFEGFLRGWSIEDRKTQHEIE